jgi:hypothetical protein
MAATEKSDMERRGSRSVAGSQIRTVPREKRTTGTDAIGRSISNSRNIRATKSGMQVPKLMYRRIVPISVVSVRY